MSAKKGVILLAIGATIFFSTALAHLSCIYFGPQCYSSQMAPPEIIESAMKGTLLAPIGTILVSAIFMVLGLYALSEAFYLFNCIFAILTKQATLSYPLVLLGC